MGYQVSPCESAAVAIKIKNKKGAAKYWVEPEAGLARPAGPRVKSLCCVDRPRGVMRELGRHLEGNVSVFAAGGFVHRTEAIGGDHQVFDREFEEQILGAETATQQCLDRIVIVRATRYRTLEYGRIRGEARYRQLLDVSPKRSARQQRPSDVVEPYALTQLMELFQRAQDPFLSETRTLRSVLPVTVRRCDEIDDSRNSTRGDRRPAQGSLPSGGVPLRCSSTSGH